VNDQDHQRREGETMTAYAWFLVIAAWFSEGGPKPPKCPHDGTRLTREGKRLRCEDGHQFGIHGWGSLDGVPCKPADILQIRLANP
jgi:hypothetical protein